MVANSCLIRQTNTFYRPFCFHSLTLSVNEELSVRETCCPWVKVSEGRKNYLHWEELKLY